jgi:hypothetical protein
MVMFFHVFTCSFLSSSGLDLLQRLSQTARMKGHLLVPSEIRRCYFAYL